MYCLGASSNAPDYTYRSAFRKWLGSRNPRTRVSIVGCIFNPDVS